MRVIFVVVALMIVAGCAGATKEPARNPADARAKMPPLEYRSAFEGYRAFADQELADWRKANEEVGAAAQHGGPHR